MIQLSANEVAEAAWRKLLDSAESGAEDWIDEDGEFTEEDESRVFDTMMFFVGRLKDKESLATLAQLGLHW